MLEPPTAGKTPVYVVQELCRRILAVFDQIPKWLNDNQGVVSILIFLATLFLGWVSGIFESLRRKPKLRLALIPGPTLCTTFLTGEKSKTYDVHRTAISVYLRIANVGTSATSIENISLGYHWDIRPLSWDWIRYRIFWYWLDHPIVTMEDFQTKLGGDKIKIYPSLIQGSPLIGSTGTHLEVGQIVSGVVYFEQAESWGGCFPHPRLGKTRIRIAVTDAFGVKHKRSFCIPVVTLDEAQKFNPSFGGTLPSLRAERTKSCGQGLPEVQNSVANAGQ